MCCTRSIAAWPTPDGKIFLHQADTTLIALDAKTGAKVWSVMDGEGRQGQSGTDAPFVFKDKVLVGVSAANLAFAAG
jgi:glucose dehydrogenase